MKSQFHTPTARAYFDCAQLGLMPITAADAAVEAVQCRSRPWDHPAPDEVAEAARAGFAAMVGACANDIALVPSASYGMTLARSLLDLAPGQSVVAIADEHPSHLLPLRALCEARGASWKEVERRRAEDPTPWVCEAIDGHTAAVCVPTCSWLDGARVDLEAIGIAARAQGALLLVDATQAAGALPIDVDAIQPDLLVASAYKWLLSPTGVGFAYVHRRHHDRLPFEDGWTHRKPPAGGWFGAGGQLAPDPPWRDGARRFDAAGSANPLLLAPALAALEWVGKVGPARIQERLAARNDAIAERHAGLGFHVPAGGATHILSCSVTDGEGVRKLLAEHGVMASIRGSLLRLSGHLWNDENDLERLEVMLKAMLHSGIAAGGR